MTPLFKALKEFPGETWQERWQAAGLNVPGNKTTTLLGHVNIQTARGYVAVFDDGVIAHRCSTCLSRSYGEPQSNR